VQETPPGYAGTTHIVVVLHLYYNIGRKTVQISHKPGAVIANIQWALQTAEMTKLNAQ